VYYVVSTEDEQIGTVEADGPDEAVRAVEAGGGDLTAREATRQEAFAYLLNEVGLSYRQLADELGTSKSYVGQRMAGRRDVRRLDVLAMERLRQVHDEQK